eukprot:365881-Chlamydomonas_euryale.AAC.1
MELQNMLPSRICSPPGYAPLQKMPPYLLAAFSHGLHTLTCTPPSPHPCSIPPPDPDTTTALPPAHTPHTSRRLQRTTCVPPHTPVLLLISWRVHIDFQIFCRQTVANRPIKQVWTWINSSPRLTAAHTHTYLLTPPARSSATLPPSHAHTRPPTSDQARRATAPPPSPPRDSPRAVRHHNPPPNTHTATPLTKPNVPLPRLPHLPAAALVPRSVKVAGACVVVLHG